MLFRSNNYCYNKMKIYYHSYLKLNSLFRDQSDNTMDKAFALYIANPDLIGGIPSIPWRTISSNS